jgi:hypothetical protein
MQELHKGNNYQYFTTWFESNRYYILLHGIKVTVIAKLLYVGLNSHFWKSLFFIYFLNKLQFLFDLSLRHI